MALGYQTMPDVRRRGSAARWLARTALVGSLAPLLLWAGMALIFFREGFVHPGIGALIEGGMAGVFILMEIAYIAFTLREGRSLIMGRRPLLAGTYLVVALGALVNLMSYGLVGLTLLFAGKFGIPPITRGETVCIGIALIVLISAVAQLVCAVVSLVKYHRVTGVSAGVPALDAGAGG